jgi:MSHA biogenesis protein MshL
VRRSLFAAACLALACATTPQPRGTSALAPAPRPAAGAPSLAPRTLSLPESKPRPPALRLLEATRFTLLLQDADLRGVLLGLGRDSPLNLVVAPDITGTVSADLEEVSMLEILEQLVVERGYRYRVEGNLLRIFREDRQTRTYQIDYPSYTRKGDTRVSLAGFMGSSVEVGGESSGGGASGGAQDNSVSQIETQQQTDLWSEIEASVRTIVFGAPDAVSEPRPEGASQEGALAARRVLVSRQSGLVSVTAESAVLGEVESYLDAVASATQRQVLIDAQIIEVRLGDDLDLGFDIEGAPDLPDDTIGVFERMIVPGLRDATLVQSLAPVLNAGGVSIGIANDSFGLILRAIARQTDVRVLSTPRVSTLNNHKAMIKVVRNQVFFVAETETIVSDDVVQTITEFVPNVIPVGVNLDVTPQVSADGDITLHVRPSVSEVVSVEPQPRASDDVPQNGSLPVVDVRETDTVLRVRDGATIVLGGLVQSREFEQERRVPGLSDIPLLGALFRNTSVSQIRTELVIFLTPTVLDPPRVTRTAVEARDRLDAVDEVGLERSHGFPWWRRPIGESYGAF